MRRMERHTTGPIVKERQTGLGLYVTAKEAYDMWQADPEGVKILDVRTPEEWVFTGHAPMATNIPFAFLAYVWDDEKKGFAWELNPDFVELVKERFSPTTRSSSRAAPAAAGRWRSTCWRPPGSRRPTTSSTGWRAAGSTIPTASSTACGRRTAGMMSGLPWTYDLDPEQMALPERETGELHPGNPED